MKVEQIIQNKIIKVLEKDYKAYVLKTIESNKAGVPDLIACIKGQFVAIEVKTPETLKRVSKLQQAHLDKVEAAQGIAIVSCDEMKLRLDLLGKGIVI